MSTETSTKVNFNHMGRVQRKFNHEWANESLFNMEKLPALVTIMVEQRRSMMDYIRELHDKIDFIMEKNHICNMPGCHTAGCTSDHK